MNLSNLFRGLLQRLCVAIKHFVLDHAHPHPSSIEIFPGDKRTMDAALVTSILECTDIDNVVVLSEPKEDTEYEGALIWIKEGDKDEIEISGSFAICRYLGRLWRLNPITPSSALVVDSALESLKTFTCHLEMLGDDRAAMTYHLTSFLNDILNDELHGETIHIGGMQSMSLCDIMYRAAIQHALTTVDESLEVVLEKNPRTIRLHEWWEREKIRYISLEETTDVEDDDADTKKTE